jgi:hypothetical protein
MCFDRQVDRKPRPVGGELQFPYSGPLVSLMHVSSRELRTGQPASITITAWSIFPSCVLCHYNVISAIGANKILPLYAFCGSEYLRGSEIPCVLFIIFDNHLNLNRDVWEGYMLLGQEIIKGREKSSGSILMQKY